MLFDVKESNLQPPNPEMQGEIKKPIESPKEVVPPAEVTEVMVKPANPQESEEVKRA